MGKMKVTFVAQYYDNNWEILEIAGDEALINQLNEDGVGYVMDWERGIGDKEQFHIALSDMPLVDGITVFCQATIEDRTTHTQDGTEYDYAWVTDVLVYHIPQEAARANAIWFCEQMIARGGYCSTKWCNRLKGTNFYAKLHGLCDRCAKEKFTRDIETARDPLYPLRRRALNEAGRWSSYWEQQSMKKEIARATTEEELLALIKKYDDDAKDSLAYWRAYQ
jgi:hypothetical protein